jgi:hypothetical protein
MNLVFKIDHEVIVVDTEEILRKVLKQVINTEVLKIINVIEFQGVKVKHNIFFDDKQLRIEIPKVKPGQDEKSYLEENKTKIQKILDKEISKFLRIDEDQVFVEKVLTIDLFAKRKRKKLYGNLYTIFNDDEVKNISAKLNHPHVRHLLESADKNIIELHEISMAYYNKYGGSILTYLMSLPKVSFSKKDCYEIKSHRRGSYLLPKLIFKKNNEEIILCFYPPTQSNYIGTILNGNNFEKLGKISKSGKIFSTSKKFTPKLTLFINPNTFEIFSGAEYGNCIICNKELKVPKSINMGYGEICAYHIGLPY